MESFTGFTEKDFNVFTIDGLDERMDGIKSEIRPKLEYLGEHFAATLSSITGEEMFYHVAKHARRTVNPPKDTWVAFANNKRGYKQHPHFQIGLWETHLFVWFAIIYESPIKGEYSVALKNNIDELKKNIPSSFVWSVDHMKPESLQHGDLSDEDLGKMIDRLKDVKKAEILCGINMDKNDPILGDGQALLAKIEDTFKTLIPFYSLSQKVHIS